MSMCVQMWAYACVLAKKHKPQTMDEEYDARILRIKKMVATATAHLGGNPIAAKRYASILGIPEPKYACKRYASI